MGKVIETVSDSIAIEILNDSTILVGKGNELHLYAKNFNNENVFVSQKLDINLTNKIHGIKNLQDSIDKKVLLVYGEKEFVLIECKDNSRFREVYRAELSDWISCGLFLKNKEFVLLTAHSIILRFSYQISESKCFVKERITCTDKSTLYCGLLLGNKWSDLIVVGGNAFGELLIWQPAKNEKNHENPLKPKVSTLIHNVSAHNGVIFSIDYDQNSQYLVTTSDDRAIKWWKVEFLSHAIWHDTKLHPLSSSYGHVARVFQGRIINEGSNIYALSVGEDSYFCLWNKKGQLIFKRRQQYGAVIWNFAYDYATKTIYTIGSTGNLVAFGLAQAFSDAQNLKSNFLQLPILQDSPTEYMTKVKFLNENHLVAVTNQNILKTSRFIGQQWQNWQNLEVKVNFKCTVMEVYQNIVAICGYKRIIVLEKQENCENFAVLHDEEVLKGLIRTFLFFNKQQYLICDDQGNCVIFRKCKKERRYLQLPKCKEPWLTTALQLNQLQQLVVSNRLGNLLLFQYQAETGNYELKSVVKHPHGNLGSTNLRCMEESSTLALIKSVGHDGALNIFSVDLMNKTLHTCSRHNIPVGWVECIEQCSRGLELFLGFNDNHFVVWCKEFDFLLQIPCGGGHRCWSFIINHGQISLVFIKNKRVCFYKTSLFNKELTALPLAKRWHVAPCNVIEILPQTCSSPHIAVTAGDDNLLKIHTFHKQCGLKEHKELHSHISNIRCLKLVPLNRNIFLIFSGGGRAQLCVTKVNSKNFHLNEVINYTLKKSETHHKVKDKLYNISPETRLMSLDVKVLIQDGEYEVFTGCSDGSIKRLKLDIKKMEIILLGQYLYEKCILQIRYLAETDLILVAATDGYLSFFPSTMSKCLNQLKHHSSGVNGLAVLYNISNKCLQILSGGDDQAICYTEISLTNLNFEIIKQFHKPYLHIAQVCACALSSNRLYGYTSGVDQAVHKINLNTGDVVASFYSCIADIKGLALIDDVCLLYGCGLQIYEFN